MRVTKIIREHVEKVVGAKYDAEIKALKATKPKPITIPDEYKKWVEMYAEKIAAECIEKLSEFGIETINDPSEAKEKYLSQTFNQGLVSQLCCILVPGNYRYIKDRAMDEYNTKLSALSNEKQNTIDDILIRLELGEVKKNELDEILAKFK